VHYIRFLLIGDEVASFVFGQTSVHLGQDLSVLAVGVELLAGGSWSAQVQEWWQR
jgi:hypothetical protein